MFVRWPFIPGPRSLDFQQSRLRNQLLISEPVVKQSTGLFAKWCYHWSTGFKGKYWLTISHRKMIQARRLSLTRGRSWAEALQKQHYTRKYVSAQEIYWAGLGNNLWTRWRKRKYWATFFTSLSYLDGNPFKSRKCIRNHRRKNFLTIKMFLFCGTKGGDVETVLQVPVLCRLMILTINYVPLHVNPLVAYSRNIRQGKKALVETVTLERSVCVVLWTASY